jgi:dolichyl-phosphate beta-glucosyltransferase
MNNIFLSVIIPAYNEEKRISTTLLSLNSYLLSKNYLYEIIIVNDGSTDSTAEVVTKFQTNIPNLRFINNKENRGKGFVVNCGMNIARGKYKLFMDADNSVKINAIENFLIEMNNGADIVIGSIALTKAIVIDHNPWYRRIFGTISKMVTRLVALPGIYDTQRGFKLFNSKAANEIFPLQTIWRFGFDIELLVIARVKKLKIKELPVVWDNPSGSTVRLKDYIRTFVELFKIILNRIIGKYNK